MLNLGPKYSLHDVPDGHGPGSQHENAWLTCEESRDAADTPFRPYDEASGERNLHFNALTGLKSRRSINRNILYLTAITIVNTYVKNSFQYSVFDLLYESYTFSSEHCLSCRASIAAKNPPLLF